MSFTHFYKRVRSWVACLGVGVCCLLSCGCGSSSDPASLSPNTSSYDSGTPYAGGSSMYKVRSFLDDVATNIEVPEDIQSLVFTDTNGDEVALKDLEGKKNVVLVFTQGFSGSLCPYCITQVSRLIANVDKFEKRDAQILVVYPGKRDHLPEFIEAAKSKEASVAKVPFPLLLDEDLSAARFFKIESRLAHPSTFILDKSGAVKLAYVGADRSAERPSIKAMLEVIDASS